MKTYQFVTELESLANNPHKKGELATLRRGLIMHDGNNPIMYQVIYPLLFKAIDVNKDEDYLLDKQRYLPVVCKLASLFTIHPSTNGSYKLNHNMGHHIRFAAGERVEAAENRLKVLLDADEDDLFDHLKHVISFIGSSKANTQINYHSLFDALIYWNSENRWIQKEWANGFWGYKSGNDSQSFKEISNN